MAKNLDHRAVDSLRVGVMCERAQSMVAMAAMRSPATARAAALTPTTRVPANGPPATAGASSSRLNHTKKARRH